MTKGSSSGDGTRAATTAVDTIEDGRSTRWDRHRISRREELVQGALRAIREHGAGVGMDDIAAAAGTSKTVYYRHFTDRAGLYQAVSDHVNALILRDLGTVLGEGHPVGGDAPPESSAQDEPRLLISAAIDAYLRLVERDPEVYRFVVSAPMLDNPSSGDPADAVSNQVADSITAVIAVALREGGQDDSPAIVWGHGIVGMVRAAADRWLADPTSRTRLQLAEDLTRLAWGGMSVAWTTEPTPATTDRLASD